MPKEKLYMDATIREKYRNFTIIDMHSHFLINAFLLKKSFFKRETPTTFWNPLKNMYDFHRAREGGVKGITFDIYVPYFPSIFAGRMGGVREFIKTYHNMIQESGGKMVHCTTAEEVQRAINNNTLAGMLAIEGGNVIEKNLENLYELKRYGVRRITLVHFLTTHIGDAVYGKRVYGGLSDFGKQMVKLMQRLGVLVDLAHATDETFFDAVRITDGPIISSHTGARKFKPGDIRGLSDEQLTAIRDTKGIAGVILFPWYLKKMKVFCKLDLVIDHICYIAEKIGVDYVGIGSDMDSNIWLPLDFKDASYFPLIPYHLEKRGFTREEIDKIMGLNYIRVLQSTDDRFRKEN